MRTRSIFIAAMLGALSMTAVAHDEVLTYEILTSPDIAESVVLIEPLAEQTDFYIHYTPAPLEVTLISLGGADLVSISPVPAAKWLFGNALVATASGIKTADHEKWLFRQRSYTANQYESIAGTGRDYLAVSEVAQSFGRSIG